MSEPQLPREVRRRLAIIQHAEEVTGNVAMTCRYYGISRQVYYRWLRRYQEQGVDGPRDLSRRPHHSPNATDVDIVGKILRARAAALPGTGHSDRQRCRIPVSLPLSRPRQRDRPPLHQTPNPPLNGKVERSHRIDAEEFYALLDESRHRRRQSSSTTNSEKWEHYYNYHRPHGGLNGQTPYERLRQKTQTRP